MKRKIIIIFICFLLVTSPLLVGYQVNENSQPPLHSIIYNENKNIFLSTRINPSISEAQVGFINVHFDSVMTSTLHNEVRERIQGPLLFLYRSIQGTWTGFDQFDWGHINTHENMFCHNSSTQNPYPNNRILTTWNSWLMDGGDLVDKNDPNALNHWINYYAYTASNQVYDYEYDGLFIDSASHKTSKGVLNGLLPDDYDRESWRDERYAALVFIKSYFPDKIVIFNGLHGRNGAEQSLNLTDGGLWETFIFQPSTGKYKGEEEWREVIELTERNNEKCYIALSAKKESLSLDIQSRMFILSSCLLVSNNNVSLTMIDLDYDELKTIYYFPEYEIDLGSPLGNYESIEDHIFIKQFEKGLVLANPNDSESYIFNLSQKYHKVIPVNGGVLKEDGTHDGYLTYELVEDEITLKPKSGVVLLNENEIDLTLSIQKPQSNKLYLFNSAIMSIKNTVILGKIRIQAEAYSSNEIDRIEFYIDEKLRYTDTEQPYEWLWDEPIIGNHKIKITVFDKEHNFVTNGINVLAFNI